VVYLAAASFCFVQWLETDGGAARRQPIEGSPTREPSYVVSSVAS
jgi:hypothetical protein